jgi:ribosome-associated protein
VAPAAGRPDEAGGASPEALALARLAGRAAAAKLGHDILALDVSQRLGLAEAFLLATGANDRQINAIVEAVEESLAAVGAQALRREGVGQANWVLLDFGDLIVHVQSAECRARYALDRLWRDCPEIDLGLDPPPARPATGPAAPPDHQSEV